MCSCLLFESVLEVFISLFFCNSCRPAAAEAIISVVDGGEDRLLLFLLLLFRILFVWNNRRGVLRVYLVCFDLI